MIDNNIGLIDVKNGDWGAAIAEFDRAIKVLKPVVERDPKNLYRLSALAWTYDNQGNVTLKLADFERQRSHDATAKRQAPI